ANTYRVNLTGVAAPAVGAILINTESKQVAGRVVAVDASGSPIVVTLAMEPLPVLYPNLVIDETIDLANAPIIFEPSIVAAYDVVRTGNTFTFTPKSMGMKAPGAANVHARSGAGENVQRADAPVPTAQVPPFKSCETTITGFTPNAAPPVALAAPPLFSISINPTVEINYDRTIGLQRFVVNAEPTVKFEGSIGLSAAFEGKFSCTVTLFTFVVPSSIPLIGGLIPVGLGFEAGGKFTLATLAIGSKVEVKTRAKAGINCPAGVNCVFERAVDNVDVKATPILDLPSIGDIRLEPSLSAFGFANLEVGNKLLNSLRFQFLKFKAGAKFAGSFASMTSQLADAMYASDYKVSLEAGASLGGSSNAVLTALGISDLSALELAISTDLAKSPTGLTSGAVTADKATFSFGDTVNFTVKLDPATLAFFPSIQPYNVKKVMLVRNNGLLPSVVASVNAVPDDHTFSFTYSATDMGTVGQFSAFIVTRAAPLDVFALEIGTAAFIPPAQIRVASGNGHSCATTAAGAVKCFGTNSVGQLGDNNPTIQFVEPPVTVSGLTLGQSMVAAGDQTSCAIDNNGALKCWGSGYQGKLGHGVIEDSAVPVQVSGLVSSVTQVAVGRYHACAILTGGTMKCWGAPEGGALGTGNFNGSSVPVNVSGSASYAAASAGDSSTCAITANGGLQCWGTNSYGMLGTGSMADFSTVPVDVTSLTSNVTAVSVGAFRTVCAVVSAGLKCWGYNGYGELGNGTFDVSRTPQDVPGLTTGVSSVAVGGNHVCALLTGGGVKCWGNNDNGQLGTGDITSSATPVDVSGLTTGAVSISAGNQHSCAVMQNGAVKCWGAFRSAVTTSPFTISGL
ncbi:MAG: hypothetical protein JNJ55_09390, partial [Betaproteobacteria bacterium]|nr:hypothetical protein [Betaproteobacteria bacterium]